MQTYISLARRYISWLKKSEGVSYYDKVLLFCVKLFYLSLRLVLLVLGKKRRNRLIEERDLYFGSVWNRIYKLPLINKKHSALLKFKMPKYNYEFYCRNNKDDFQVMTFHEYDIIDHNFTSKESDVVIDVGVLDNLRSSKTEEYHHHNNIDSTKENQEGFTLESKCNKDHKR